MDITCKGLCDIDSHISWYLSYFRGIVLGQTLSPRSSSTRQLIQATWSGKAFKPTNPSQTFKAFQTTINGIQQYIKVTEDDIRNLKISDDESDRIQNCSEAENYLERLVKKLARLEYLHKTYMNHYNMKKGTETLAHAYILNSEREKNQALNNVRSGYKECSLILSNIESELDFLMGLFHFEIRGLKGFARLCPGDVYEITIRYGHQKWKSKCQILKDAQQSWESSKITLKSLLGEHLYIKTAELKGLRKIVPLGEKCCETSDLFSANPQLMTVNLNISGTIKLNMLVTWSPFHRAKQTSNDQLPLSPFFMAVLDTPFKKRIQPQDSLSDDTSSLQSASKNTVSSKINPLHSPKLSVRSKKPTKLSEVFYDDMDTKSKNLAPHLSSYVSNDHFQTVKTKKTTENETTLLSYTFDQMKPESPNLEKIEANTSQRWSHRKFDNIFVQSIRDKEGSGMSSELSDSSLALQCLLRDLCSTLEDIQGQYEELDKLNDNITKLEQLLVKNQDGSKLDSMDASDISVRNTLKSFDFLDSIDDVSQQRNKKEMITTESDNKEKKQNDATQDKGCESSDAPKLTSGYKQLDLAITESLKQCQKLIENLGSFGPLKNTHESSLDKLRKQTKVIECMVRLSHSAKLAGIYPSGYVFLETQPNLQKLWIQCSEDRSALCVTVKSILPKLGMFVREYLISTQQHLALKVAEHWLMAILEVNKLDHQAVITVFQLKVYYDYQQMPLKTIITSLAEEITQIELLRSRDENTVKKTLTDMETLCCSLDSLLVVSHLLIDENVKFKKLAESYLTNACKTDSLREKLLTVYLGALESEIPQTRQSACAALAVLKASEYIKELVHLSQTDPDQLVQQEAKYTLFSFGIEGKKAFQEQNMVTHGFKSLQMKEMKN
ncbi:rho family-interacting cell polarization regulator 2-like isoform X2 [Tachypleus tridentatus]|uniref:rho family-interacting cell polarization regulator 2-like isoform X2 n=1 Tax=Tachypleus tridentatus TaxID=6853 RepID=UPI003FD38CEF